MASLASDYDSDKNPISQMSEKSALLKLDGSLAVSRSWVVKKHPFERYSSCLGFRYGSTLMEPKHAFSWDVN